MKIRFFELAKKLSNKSDHPAHKLGCIITKKNRIISVGWNLMKTNPRSNHPYKSIHAEFAAIIGASPADLRGSTAYIYRERKDGTLGCARSCNSCLEIFRNVGVEKICFSDYNGYKEEEI